MNPGSIVKVRERLWVLLPSEGQETIRLRPLTGATDETVALHRGLSDLLGYSLPTERLQPATFPLPTPDDLADAASAHLLWQAARLTLREGASPLRSLGRISIRPRTYQFVPLLMALRQNPVRLLIADDVGVGKTIEALLIARELWERGEIRRLAVVCPPYLCDQWQKELQEKFNLDAVIIRSGTVRQLERHLPPTVTIYQHYPVQVISIDFIKTDRNRYAFLQNPPEMIIVDEAHGATQSNSRSHQQRHDFIARVAAHADRHLILLTATPHSGIESAFRSLLGLLKPEFADWDVSDLTDAQLSELARHFVQRTRKDIESDWEQEDGFRFPQRLSEERQYTLSPAYRKLFDETYAFCAEIVRTGQRLEERKRRVRFWGALALLRCVMSSPAAALATLESRHARLSGEDDEGGLDYRDFVLESDQEYPEDEQPLGVFSEAETEKRKLRALGKIAARLRNSPADTKLTGLVQTVDELLRDGFAPIIWCRYVATAEYVADALTEHLGKAYPGLDVACITGRQGDEERRARIDAIDAERPHVLVATDCLSEGINLQEKFNAVVHYDLPWNPNRLEQREGRVDRFGQKKEQVRVVRYYGQKNPVDGVVLEVLLRKAREIHDALGTYVPVPADSESVTQAVLEALFLRGGYRKDPHQLTFDWWPDEVTVLHRRWEQDAARERRNRTRFAQRALKPAEVRRELEAADAVLGDPDAVRDFVLEAANRLGLHLRQDKKQPKVYRIPLGDGALPPNLPDAVRFALPEEAGDEWRITFVSPTPEGAEYLGRNHPFVAALARFLLEAALNGQHKGWVARCGALAAREVSRPVRLYLLRVRYLVHQPGGDLLFSEEVRVLGREADAWLDDDLALRLLAAPPAANLPPKTKRRVVEEALADWEALAAEVEARLQRRAGELTAAHRRVRRAMKAGARQLRVEPRLPADLLGVLVLLPVEEGA